MSGAAPQSWRTPRWRNWRPARPPRGVGRRTGRAFSWRASSATATSTPSWTCAPKSRWRRRAPPTRAGRGRDRAAAGRADRAQGRLRHARLAYHGGEPHPGGLSQPLRRHGGREPGAGRHGLPGQAQLRRVRDGLEQREQRLRQRPQPLGPRRRSGRLLGRLGRGRRGAPGAARHGHRYRRLDPRAGGLQRHHRHQAHLRAAVALGHGRLRLQPGHRRPAHRRRAGLRPGLQRDARLRRARFDQRRPAARGLHAQPDTRPDGPAHRRAHGVLRRRPRARGRAAPARRCASTRALGARLVEVSLPNAALGIPVYYVVACAEASSNLSALRRRALWLSAPSSTTTCST